MPYPNGYFQLHGMTKNITLFEDGLVSTHEKSSYPKLPEHFIDKIKQLSDELVTKKSQEIAQKRGYPKDMGKRCFKA